MSDLVMENVDPLANAWNASYLDLVYDSLVGGASDGTHSTQTGLAYKWEMSPDALTWTFYLRKGVRFHNGDNLTAEDVKFSIQRVTRKDSKMSHASQLAGMIKDIKVVDEYTLVIQAPKPSPFLHNFLSPFESRLGLVVPKKYIEQNGDDYFLRHPVGSGPYKFHSQSYGDFIKLEAVNYEHWRDGPSRYETIIFKKVPEETTRVALLRAGGADIVEVSREKAKELAAAGFQLFSKPGAAVLSLKFAGGAVPGSPLADKRVREAVSLAINRDEIAKFILGGRAKVTGTHVGSWGLEYPYVDPTPQRYDLARAKALFDSYRAEQGDFTISIYRVARADLPENLAVADAVAGYIKAAGAKTAIVPIEWGALRAKWVENKVDPPGLFIGPVPGRTMWLGMYTSYMHSKKASLPTWFDPELDRLLDAAGAAMSVEGYGRATAQMDAYVQQNYYILPLAEIDSVVAATTAINKNWDLGGKVPNDWRLNGTK